MKPVHIGSRREVCWDDALIEKSQGIQIQLHKPQYRGDALVCDKPWEGNTLSMNFATSALGFIRVRILDESGAPIEGYDSGRHFGDTLDRPVDFEKPLAALNGNTVRLEITMKDAELYSFRFA